MFIFLRSEAKNKQSLEHHNQSRARTILMAPMYHCVLCVICKPGRTVSHSHRIHKSTCIDCAFSASTPVSTVLPEQSVSSSHTHTHTPSYLSLSFTFLIPPLTLLPPLRPLFSTMRQSGPSGTGSWLMEGEMGRK